MKKTTLFCLLLTASILADAQSKKDYTILSGTIKNVLRQVNGKKQIALNPPFHLKGEGSQIIELSDDGSFTDTIRTGTGVYYIYDNKNMVPVYLQKGNKYFISYNIENFRDKGEVVLNGADTAVNRYFIEKIQNRVIIDRLNIKKTEETFRAEMSKIREDQLNRINKARLPEKLRLEENKEIQYIYLSELHFFISQKEQSNPSYSPLPVSERELNVNYNNEAEYKKQPYYAKLVDLHYAKEMDKAGELNKRQNSSYALRQNIIRLFDSLVPNQHIKNDLIRQYAGFNLKEVPDKKSFYNDFKRYYTGSDKAFMAEMENGYLRYSKLKRGMPSPGFANYLNYNGGNNSLKDYQGRYVYIDIWATWCMNCWEQIPHLKKLEEELKDKNIVFVSLSWDKFESTWRETIKKQRLGGIQLLAKDRSDDFFKEYAVNGIPRYILIGPDGTIIDYNAPRPSETENLKLLFKSAGL